MTLVDVPLLTAYSWLLSGGNGEGLTGSKIYHSSRGWGALQFIKASKGLGSCRITFGDGHGRICQPADLRNTRHWRKILIPEGLASNILASRNSPHRLAEQKQYRLLCDEYGVHRPEFTWLVEDRSNPVWTIFDILMSTENEPQWVPSRETISWLEELGLSRLLALLYERRFRSTGNIENLASASRHWRIVGEPRRAIAATDPIAREPKRFEKSSVAAALVSRAAALLDVGNVAAAEEVLRTAMGFGADRKYTANVWARLDSKGR